MITDVTLVGPTVPRVGWTAGGAGGTNTLGNGVGNISWSSAIPMADAEQLQIGIAVISAAGDTVVMQLAGSHDGTTFYPVTVRSVGAVVGAAQRYSAPTYELGPITGIAAPGTFLDEARPWAWHFCRIGFYCVGAPAAGTVVNVTVERQRTSAQVQGLV